jgi:hypothetical protein
MSPAPIHSRTYSIARLHDHQFGLCNGNGFGFDFAFADDMIDFG